MFRTINGDIIDTPMIDEVLSDGFLYSDFMINHKNIEDDLSDIDMDSIAKYILELSKRELTKEEKIYQEYDKKIRNVQKEYDGSNDKYCTDKMIEIASLYKNKLDDLKKHDESLERLLKVLNLAIDKKTSDMMRQNELENKKKEEKIIEDKMKEFIEKKRREEGIQRLKDYVSGKIRLGDLHLYDFLYLRDTDVYKTYRKQFIKLQRHVFSKLEMTDDDNDIYRPIFDLPKQKKGKKH